MRNLTDIQFWFARVKAAFSDQMIELNELQQSGLPYDESFPVRMQAAYTFINDVDWRISNTPSELDTIVKQIYKIIAFVGTALPDPAEFYNSNIGNTNIVVGNGIAVPLATNTIYGKVRLNVAADVATDPVALGANDPRIAQWVTAYNRSITGISINSAGQIVVDRQNDVQVTSAQSVIINQSSDPQDASYYINGTARVVGQGRFDDDFLLTGIQNIGSPATNFLAWNDTTGDVTWRTSAEVLSDIGGAPASGSGNYIQNQNASAQTANAWINGTLRADTRVQLGDNYWFNPANISFTNYSGGAVTNRPSLVLANTSGGTRTWAFANSTTTIGVIDFSDITRMVFQNFNGGIGFAPGVGNEVVAQRRFRIGTYGLLNDGIFITPQKSYNGNNVQAIEQIQSLRLALISTVEDGNIIPHLVASDTTSAVANYSATNTYWRLERNNTPFLDVTYDGRIRPYNIPALGSAATTFLTVSGNFIQSRTAFQTLQDTGAFRYLAGISTGLQSGGLLSIDTDPTKFDLSAGYGIVVDDTDPLNPVATAVTWSAFNAQTVTNLGTQVVTYIGINSAGAIVQQSTIFTNAQRRSIIQIGAVVHSNLTTINAVNNFPAVINETTSQVHDLMTGLGIFNVNGNIYSANGANLNINKSSGAIFKLGSNFEIDPNNPNERTTVSLTALTFRYRLRNSTEYPDTTNIDPNNYDNSGVLTAVPVNRWTVQRIYLSQTNATRIQYGQNVYNTFAEASAAINSESFITEQNIAENLLLRGFLVVKQGTTALNNTADAQFFSAAKFGANAIGAGTSTTTLQQAYLNSTIPQITTTAALGAVTMRRGSAADTDNVLVVQNGAGSNVMSVTGAGVMTLATALGVASGGTGLSSTPTNGQIDIGNGTGFTRATLTGTANQVTVTNGSGSITLSLPQSIATTSSPTFANITISTIANIVGNANFSNTNTAIKNLSSPSIYSSTTSGAAYPFTEAGHLVLEPRLSGAVRDVVIIGASSNVVARFKGDLSISNIYTPLSVTGALSLGTPLGVSSGGTGLSTAPTNGQLLIGNGTAYALATLTGTANQVTVTNGAGSITLSLPQSIATTSSPTFANGTFTGNLTVDTNTFFVDSVNNRVGIGSTILSHRFNITQNNSGLNTGIFSLTNTGAAANSGTSIEFNGANGAAQIVNMARIGTLITNGTPGNESSDIEISTISGGVFSEKVRILANGNVLIGTTLNPNNRKLLVSGTTEITGNTTIGGTLAVTGSTLIGSGSSVASALLTMNSTTQGFRPPVMTTAQKNAIASPTAGLIVYDSTLSALALYTSAWQQMITGSGTIGTIPLFTAAGAIGNSIMSESAGVVTTTGAQSINTTFGTSLSLLMTDNDTDGTKNITQVIRNTTNYLVGYDFSAYTEYSFQTQWTGAVPNTYTSAAIRSGFDIDGGTGGAPYAGTLRFHTFWGDTNGGGALTEHLLLYGDATNPYARLFGALELNTTPATATSAGAYDLLVRDAGANGTIKQISSNATGFIKLRRASINALVTGTYVLSNLQDNFIPVGYSIVVNNATAVATDATISIGTNSPNYDNIAALPLVGVTNANATDDVFTSFFNDVEKFRLMSSNDLRVNVSVAATGTTYSIDIILFGYVIT